MRRLLSILLLAAFALPLVAPALALAQDPDAGLPACCRRHGHHHCAMLDPARDPSAHRIVAVCAAWPQRALAPCSAVHLLGVRAPDAPLPLRTIVSPSARSNSRRATRIDRSHPKRGPPAFSSLT
ncbi:MAG TPA: hypothetical protein VGM11_01500 [Acidobacteriaceae bacterium]|jgi:hypothetical protein